MLRLGQPSSTQVDSLTGLTSYENDTEDGPIDLHADWGSLDDPELVASACVLEPPDDCFPANPDDDPTPVPFVSKVEDIKIAMEFIDGLKDARLDQSDLAPDDLERLRNPPQHVLE